jgi:hypothetical protein
VAIDRPVGPGGGWDRWFGWMSVGNGTAGGRTPFQSDHAFESMVSPVTRPSIFEDPRALTELRPIFMWQGASSNNPIFHGGYSLFFGTQARLAFTDQLSVVMNQLGFVHLHPYDPPPPFHTETLFTDVKLGPKWTFYRCPSSGTVAAAGLTFEIPTNSSRVWENHGSLSLDPYLSVGQTICLPSGFGAINLLGEMGYSFSVDNNRAEFFHLSTHVDYNIARTNFFPFLEMTWLRYTREGHGAPLGFEGADLINFGSSNVGPRNYLTLGVGTRYRFSECVQVGGAIEWPLTGQHDLSDFRVTFDVIFRY